MKLAQGCSSVSVHSELVLRLTNAATIYVILTLRFELFAEQELLSRLLFSEAHSGATRPRSRAHRDHR
jgi:hypothetical protein